MSGDEIHPYHEILYYMKGDAAFLSEQFEEVLEENTLLIIPKEAYHKFRIGDQADYTRLVLNFPDIAELNGLISTVLSEIKIIKPINPNISHLLNRIIGVLSEKKQENTANSLLYAAFNMLLAELSSASLPTAMPEIRESDLLISRCIKFIDQNFTKDISVEQIAKEMGVSTSSLHLCFKRHLDISVYKYITEKRLINAHKLITRGASPTKIYHDCGYNDYPTFYKAYKNKFGISPSNR